MARAKIWCWNYENAWTYLHVIHNFWHRRHLVVPEMRKSINNFILRVTHTHTHVTNLASSQKSATFLVLLVTFIVY